MVRENKAAWKASYFIKVVVSRRNEMNLFLDSNDDNITRLNVFHQGIRARNS